MDQVLCQLVDQFKASHKGSNPKEVVVTPAALASLAIKSSVTVKVQSTPVVSYLFDPKEVRPPGKGSRLGVYVRDEDGNLSLQACDLA